ncbi:MAG: hypothetical protein Q7R47_06190, partial [Candidatus Diapherotrites archaeon]|nr:hypothetical protein [Candidatus Diapherotrites archaeon]
METKNRMALLVLLAAVVFISGCISGWDPNAVCEKIWNNDVDTLRFGANTICNEEDGGTIVCDNAMCINPSDPKYQEDLQNVQNQIHDAESNPLLNLFVTDAFPKYLKDIINSPSTQSKMLNTVCRRSCGPFGCNWDFVQPPTPPATCTALDILCNLGNAGSNGSDAWMTYNRVCDVGQTCTIMDALPNPNASQDQLAYAVNNAVCAAPDALNGFLDLKTSEANADCPAGYEKLSPVPLKAGNDGYNICARRGVPQVTDLKAVESTTGDFTSVCNEADYAPLLIGTSGSVGSGPVFTGADAKKNQICEKAKGPGIIDVKIVSDAACPTPTEYTALSDAQNTPIRFKGTDELEYLFCVKRQGAPPSACACKSVEEQKAIACGDETAWKALTPGCQTDPKCTARFGTQCTTDPAKPFCDLSANPKVCIGAGQ